ncbi:hypothetical protein GR268_43710 [Rhizobium leguminosarum]|nr:hypothetical protein [Rhizobium leguminosarum]
MKAGKMLMRLLEEEKTVNQTVGSIRKMMVQGPGTKLGLLLYEQALKKLPSDYIGTVEEYIAARTKETLGMLDNMQTLCIQLKDIVIATTSLRNKSSMELYHFLQ